MKQGTEVLVNAPGLTKSKYPQNTKKASDNFRVPVFKYSHARQIIVFPGTSDLRHGSEDSYLFHYFWKDKRNEQMIFKFPISS
jgi:hypothetical protein